MKSLIKDHILNMKGYIPGEQPQDLSVIKLNTNENPFDPPDAVLKSLADVSADDLRKYPPAVAQELRESLAEVYALKTDGLIIGNGSDEILTMLMRACVAPDESVAYPEPTYVLYKTLAEIQGAKVKGFPFDRNFDIALEDVASLDAKIFFLANPNSPSGTMMPKSKVKQLANSFSGLFVVDEAYVDFAEDNCLSLVDECDNVIVLRTMSKSFSLAGIRLGWAYGRPELISELMKVKDSYNVNAVTQKVALAALQAKEQIDERVQQIVSLRDQVASELMQRSWVLTDSQANFLWAQPPGNAQDIYETLKEKKIYVRYFKELSDCLRITVGSPDEMQQLLNVIDKL